MKVSEAILKGCKGTKKLKNLLWPDGESRHTPTKCCGMGAAGLGMNGDAGKVDEILDTLGRELWSECVRRNNETNQSRQSIARWLAKQGL